MSDPANGLLPHGFVYLLANAAMPGLFKVGHTARNPFERVRELSSATAVPAPYELVSAVFVNDAPRAEESLHSAFSTRRRSQTREFFQFSNADEAKEHFQQVVRTLDWQIADLGFGDAASDALEIKRLTSALDQVHSRVRRLEAENDQLKARAIAEKEAKESWETGVYRTAAQSTGHMRKLEKIIRDTILYCEKNPRATGYQVGQFIRTL